MRDDMYPGDENRGELLEEDQPYERLSSATFTVQADFEGGNLVVTASLTFTWS